MASGTSASQESLVDLLPAEIQGFKPGGRDEIYSFDNLFKLIDGGAEVYRALNVRTVLDRRYVKKDAHLRNETNNPLQLNWLDNFIQYLLLISHSLHGYSYDGTCL